MQIVEVVTTVGSEQEAHVLAERVVASRLAACAQVDGPIASIYRWQGKTESSREYRVTLKSSVALGGQIESWIKSHHPYDLPQILLREVSASDEFGAWVCSETEAEPS